MWKAPNRPKGEVTQGYNSGVVRIFSVTDTAEPGYKPTEGLTLKSTLRYDERQLGIRRYYSGRQNMVDIERVIRVPRGAGVITNQDVAVTEDGRQYGIDMVAAVDGVYPPSLDLTLTKIEQVYEVEP